MPTSRAVATAACAAAVSLAVFAVARHFAAVSMVDMLVYRAEGLAVTTGQDLYGMHLPGRDLVATYPPFAAILFVPSTWFGVSTLRALVMVVNLGLLALLAHYSLRLAGVRRRHQAVAVLLLTGFGVWLEPVWTTLRYGQVNLAIACLVLHDLTRPDSNRLKGIGIGLAAGLKLTPGLFAVYLLLTGRVRAALLAGATFLGTALLGWAALPAASHEFWTRYLYDPTRVGQVQLVDNQSLRGAAARLLGTADPGLPALLASGVTAVAGLSVAVLVARGGGGPRRAEAWGVLCTAVTALLVSPISWTHHWVWCVPLLVLLAVEARQESLAPAGLRRAVRRPALVAGLVAFGSYAMWLVPRGGSVLRLALWQQAAAACYPLTGLAVLALTAVRLARHRLRRPTEEA